MVESNAHAHMYTLCPCTLPLWLVSLFHLGTCAWRETEIERKANPSCSFCCIWPKRHTGVKQINRKMWSHSSYWYHPNCTALRKEIKPYTYFYAPFVRKWMALGGSAYADELLLLKLKTGMLYHFNEVSDRYSRLLQRQLGICKKQMRGQSGLRWSLGCLQWNDLD